MKASVILFFCLGQSALSWDLSRRQSDDVCLQGDLCANEVEGAANGSVYESMAEADCVSFMMHTATVAPVLFYHSTVTSYSETTVTATPNATATLAARGVAGAAAEAAAYAVSFSKTVPCVCVSYCDTDIFQFIIQLCFSQHQPGVFYFLGVPAPNSPGITTVLTLPAETTVGTAISTVINANTTVLVLPTASTVGTAISTFIPANTTVLVLPTETTININSTITATFTTNITTTIVPVATSSALPPVNCTNPTPNFCPGAPCVDFFNDASNCGACGHVCASGICQNGVCGANACDGSVCGAFTSCGLSGSCICTTQESGQGFCLDGNTPCSALADCDSNADCGGGQICAVSTCCDRNVCIGAGVCDNGMRPRNIFRPRGSTGKVEKTVGGNFYEYLDVSGKSA
ncbi:hypothetical protein K490DRAFT_55064 [Saccharata proteae CBS 121410]|uniref:IGFBP N-terminal domain-containing protein n=1 Tax=Saccharata proteae CBS 121410 TaxID=1314787 RepID=A0A6A5YCN0_9PEZI|nr:hypothetical protein K490DRAFT_55064 [Saccharata proteae CBS 121410]